MDSNASMLIIAKPGELRESLYALLSTVPQIGRLHRADSGPAALGHAEIPPRLLLLDFNLPCPGLPATLRQLRTRWPQACTLVLVDNLHEQQLAVAAGADRVLPKGVRPARFLAEIETLLKQPVRQSTDTQHTLRG